MIEQWLEQSSLKPCFIEGYKGLSQMIGISWDFS